MRQINFPPDIIFSVLECLDEMTEDDLRDFLSEIENAPPDADIAGLYNSNLATPLRFNLLQALIRLNRHHHSLADQPRAAAAYIAQFMGLLKNIPQPKTSKITSTKINLLSRYLEAALLPRSSLGLAFKTNDLRTYHQNNFSRVQIVSDIRPVFHSDDSVSKPLSALITHSMHLSFVRANGDTEDIFIGLDTEELLEIEASIARAIQKTKVLSEMLQSLELV